VEIILSGLEATGKAQGRENKSSATRPNVSGKYTKQQNKTMDGIYILSENDT
jgi:hypothetical protein